MIKFFEMEYRLELCITLCSCVVVMFFHDQEVQVRSHMNFEEGTKTTFINVNMSRCTLRFQGSFIRP